VGGGYTTDRRTGNRPGPGRFRAREATDPSIEAGDLVGTMATSPVVVALVLVVLGTAGLLSAPAATAAPPTAPLTAAAEFTGWTWFGPGSPCGGGPVTFVAHFASNVSGGAAPYTYAWSFGDGSPGATGPDPTHDYPADGAKTWTATLTVTDATGATATNSTRVDPDTYSCPAEPARGQFAPTVVPFPLSTPGGLLLLSGGLAVVVVAALLVARRRRRSGREPPMA
jgi:PKD domain